MIKGITVENYIGDTIHFSLTKPEESGFILTKIDGLGPVDATVNQSRYANLDGARNNSVYAQPRTVILYFDFLENPSIEATRLKSYRYFPLKQKIKLTIETDSRTAVVYGIVKDNDPDIFAKKESAAITIQCEKSYFADAMKSDKILFGSIPRFRFPFSNPSPNVKTLQMSEQASKDYRNITYEGDGEVGVIITIKCKGTVNNLLVYQYETYQQLKIRTDYLQALTGFGLKDRDIVKVNTIEGERSATLYRDGNEINIINALDKDPQWFKLRNGDNYFGCTADSGIEHVTMDISYDILYEGV